MWKITAASFKPTSKTGISGVSESGIHDDFDLNSEEYSFLPMEDFDWERNAYEVVGEYVEGLEDVLDDYFRWAREINDDTNDDDDVPLSPSAFTNQDSRTNSFEFDNNMHSGVDMMFSPESVPSGSHFSHLHQSLNNKYYTHNPQSPNNTINSNDSSFSVGHSYPASSTPGTKSNERSCLVLRFTFVGHSKG